MLSYIGGLLDKKHVANITTSTAQDKRDKQPPPLHLKEHDHIPWLDLASARPNIKSQLTPFLSLVTKLDQAAIGKSSRPSPDQLAGKYVYAHHAV